MTMPEDIAQRLSDLHLGTYRPNGTQGDISILQMPNAPDNCICIYQYAGSPRLNKVLDSIQMPGLQIVVRAQYGVDALDRITQIVDALDQTSFMINKTYYPQVIAKQEPFLLKIDEKNRHYYAVNFTIYRRAK